MSDVVTRIILQEDASSKLQAMTSAARSSAAQLQQVGRQIDNAFRTNAPDQFASRLGNAVNQTSAEVDSLGDSIDRAMEGLDGGATALLGNSFSSAASGAQDLSRAVEDAGRNVDDLADSAGELGENLEDVGGGGLGDVADDAGEAGRELENASGKASKLKGLLAGIAAAVSLAAIGHQVGGLISDSVDVGKQFTATMSEVQAISGATGAELESLEDTARQYGATTIFSASQAGDALKYMALAGWDANQSSSALGGVLNLAAASGMELGQASDMVTDYLSAFGMAANQAGYFADMLTYAQGHSNTSTMQLGEAFLNSAAIMNSAGQDVETTTALLEGMANQGTKGSRAGTQLAAMMRDITNSMEDGHIMIGDTAVAVQDAYGNFRDLTDILYDVESAVDGLGTADRASALAMTFTADSTRGVNQILTEGVDKIAGYEEELRKSAGTAQTAADVMNDNLKGDLANMNSAFEEMQLQVYEGLESPLRNVVQTATDEFIPALTEFVPAAIGGVAGTVGKFADAMMPLITTVLRNPQAVGNAFTAIGAGMLAFKGVGVASNIASAVTGTGELTGVLGKLAEVITGNPWAVGSAAAVAGIVAITAAIEKYNETQIQTNLTEHFGDISLDETQAADLASKYVPVDITAQLQLAGVSFNEADELVTKAEDLLEQNDFINWKVANVNGTLPEGEGAIVLENTQGFVDSVTAAIEKEEYAAELVIDATVAEGSDKTNIISTLQGWFKEDSATASQLGSAVTTIVENAINEGTYNVNTATAVSIMQQKMLDIVNGAQEAELAGKLKWIEQRAGLAALDDESWKLVVEDMSELQQELIDQSDQQSMSLFGMIEQRVHNDKSRRGEADLMENFLSANFENLNAGTIAQTWSSMFSSLNTAYDEELESSRASLAESTSSWVENLTNQLHNVEVGTEYADTAYNNMFMTAADITGGLGKADRGALLDRFETMLPTVDQLRDAIDKSTGPVPQAVMDSYKQALELGAAGGDEGAIAGMVAQQIAADFGDRESFESALEAAGFSVNMLSAIFGETFEGELNRAFTETSNLDVTGFLENLSASLASENVDWSEVVDLFQSVGLDISSELERQGIDVSGDVPVNAENLNIDMESIMNNIEGLSATGEAIEVDGGQIMVQYEVTAGQTLSGIAQEIGITTQELIDANPDIQDPNYIEIGQIINMPIESVQMDENVGEVAQSAADEAAAGAEQPTTEVPTNTTLMPGETDASELRSGAQTSADDQFADPLETDGLANITLEQTNNAGTVYSNVESDLRNVFGTVFNIPAKANVSVSVDYSIANPTSTVTIGGAGSGIGTLTASIAGHAEGGYFDSPHLAMVAEGGYGEWIIPDNGSDESRAMALDAARALGMTDQESAISPIDAPSGRDEAATGSSSEKVITLNVNGGGSIQVSGSGVSKEQIVEILLENMREAFMNIVQQEIIEEGDGVYEF